MIYAILATIALVFNHIEDDTGQIAGIGWRAHLVENHFAHIPFASNAKHRFHKIVSEFAVKPPCTDKDTMAAHFGNSFLAVHLGAAVGTGRIQRGILIARCIVAIAAKNIVGGDMNQCSAADLHRISQMTHREAIHQLGRRFLILGAVDIGIGRAVNDHIDAIGKHEVENSIPPCDVEIVDIRKEISMLRLRTQQSQMAAQLSV